MLFHVLVVPILLLFKAVGLIVPLVCCQSFRSQVLILVGLFEVEFLVRRCFGGLSLLIYKAPVVGFPLFRT